MQTSNYFYFDTEVMHSGLPRCGTPRGLGTRFSLVGPAKVNGRKYFLFPEGSLRG